MSVLDDYKERLRDSLDAYAKEKGIRKFSECSSVLKGKLFLQYYLNEFFDSEYPDIGEEILSACVIDGANDLGIDFLYDDESKIVIIQSKYGKNQVSREVLSDFKDIPSRIRSGQYINKKGNAYLKSIVEEIKNLPSKPIRLIFLTDQLISKDNKNYWEQSITKGNKEVEVTIADIEYLKDEFARIASQVDDVPDVVNIAIGGEDYFEFTTVDENYKTVLLTQQGSKIKNLYNEHKERLFNHNIRFWLGKNPVNKAMIETINVEPERFFYFNNGLTAVCESFEVIEEKSGRTLRCNKLQIINGAQTFTTIAKEGSSNISNVKVLIKIIEAKDSDDNSNLSSLKESIVKNTNNQTAVLVSDFKSNDPIQLFIESELQKIVNKTISPHKSLSYKRKRSKVPTQKGYQFVTMQDLGKAYYSGFFGPVDLNASVNRLWDSSVERGLYNVAFGNDGMRTDSFSKNRINKMLAAYFIYEHIKSVSKLKTKEEDPSQLFKYHILWGILRLIRDKHNQETTEQNIYNSIVEKGSLLNKSLFPDDYKKFVEYFETVSGAINYLVTEASQEASLVMRNIQRSKKFFDKLERYLVNTKAISKLEYLN